MYFDVKNHPQFDTRLGRLDWLLYISSQFNQITVKSCVTRRHMVLICLNAREYCEFLIRFIAFANGSSAVELKQKEKC